MKSLFPLLRKEAIDEANKKRTYIVRVVYGSLLYIFFGWLWNQHSGKSIVELFGTGAIILPQTFAIQIFGILFFMPILASASIVKEKERNALSLLFLSRLSSWEIILEKFIASLIPGFTFIFISLPVIALGYSMGGVGQSYIYWGIVLTFLFIMLTTALSLFASSFCSNSTQALICTYFFEVLVVYLIPLFLLSVNPNISPRVRNFNRLKPFFISNVLDSQLHRTALSLYTFLFTLFSLKLTHIFLKRRVFVKPKNYLLLLFKKLDSLAHKGNHYIGNISFGKDSILPKDKPIVWRECHKKSLGTLRYLLRIFVILEIIVLMLIFIGFTSGRRSGQLFIYYSNLFFLSFGAIIITIQSTKFFTSERKHQTLEVLMTTPITLKNIILEKMSGIKRLIFVLFLPFLTLVIGRWYIAAIYSGYFSWDRLGGFRVSESLFILLNITGFVFFTYLTCWIMIFIGLKCKASNKTTLIGLVLLFIWWFLPFILLYLTNHSSNTYSSYYISRQKIDFFKSVIATISPLCIFASFQSMPPMKFHTYWPLVWITNVLISGGILFWIRKKCLQNAEKYLQETC